MKKLIIPLLAIVAIGCIPMKPDRACHYKVEYDSKIDTIWTDHISISTGGLGDDTDSYYFYLNGEIIARLSGTSVLIKKLD